jgi:PST family polysaccharide transporter
MSKKPKLSANIAWMYGLQGLNYLVPAALLPYLVRTLGVENYGLIAFAQSIAQYFILATDYGFNFSATRSISKSREDNKEVSRIFWTVLTIKLLLLTAGGIVLAVIVLAIPRLHQDMGVYLAAYLAVAGNALFPLWLFQGIEQMRSISIFTGLGRLLAAVLVVLLVKGPKDTVLATALLSFGFVFAGLLGMTVALRKHIKHFHRPVRSEIVTALSEGRHLFITTAAVSLYSNTNTFLVGILAGVEQAGYFALADKLIRAISGIIAPVIQATYPHMIALMTKSKEQALIFIRKVAFAAIGGGLVFGLALILEARPLAGLAFSRQNNLTVVHLLQILALFPLLSALNYVFGVLLLIPFGFDKEQSRLLLAIGAGNVLLGFLLIPSMGAIGGVVTMTITETVQVIGCTLLIRRNNIRVFRATVRNA